MANLMIGVLLACMTIASALASHPFEQAPVDTRRRELVAELGLAGFENVYVPCSIDVIDGGRAPGPSNGNGTGCFNAKIPALGNGDFLWGAPMITYPTDGTPYGVHVSGPYPNGHEYLISWLSGSPQGGLGKPLPTPTPLDTSDWVSTVTLSTIAGGSQSVPASVPAGSNKKNAGLVFNGAVITYQRIYTDFTSAGTNNASAANYTYTSPYISHVVVSLKPQTTYFYTLWGNGTLKSKEYAFTTLANQNSGTASKYPLKVGIIADVGQTANSSVTRDRLGAGGPDVIVHVGDNSYSDDYGFASPEYFPGLAVNEYLSGCNDNRWDSYAVLWDPLYSSTPVLNCAGNHELEQRGIGAVVNYTTQNFSFPSNYPFQAYANRWPTPGTYNDFGNINNAMWYSTIVGGVIKLITLNNYVPFYPGSPQYKWAVLELAGVDRVQTPWLVVQFHSPIYHTYYTHYKEQECFRGVYEDLFYAAGVDLVLGGHIHAYERTHPVYNYERDNCAPMYITIGDGGNIEGPYRNFVDELDPLAQNVTFASMLKPNPQTVSPYGWGPSYQLQAHAPNCPTTSWQKASGVAGGPGLITNPADPTTFFAQSSQPTWSAYRDPAFGFAMLTINSESTASFNWYRNMDPAGQPSDSISFVRVTDACSGLSRKRRLSAMAAKIRRAM